MRRWIRFTKNLLGQYQWYRRWEVGHWELWKLPGNYGSAWVRTSACFYARGRSPDPRLVGRPEKCEHCWDTRNEFISFEDIFELPACLPCPVCNEAMDQHPVAQLADTDPLDERPVRKICTGQLVRLVVLPDCKKMETQGFTAKKDSGKLPL